MGAKKNNADGENNTYITMIFKVDMHCKGCASKIKRDVCSIQGVETAKADSETGKLTVIGKVEPTELREKLSEKIKKKVELISPPQPKKEKNNNENKDTESNIKTEKKKNDDKKPKDKEAAVTTATLKLVLHCQGCIDKIGKYVSKYKGVEGKFIDTEKETVTVKGTMDVKALAENLMERFKRKVEVVSPKKDNDDKEGGGKKKKEEGGGKKKKEEGGGGDHNNNYHNEEWQMEQSRRMEYYNLVQHQHPHACGYGYGYANVCGYNYNYGQVYHEQLHAQPPQNMFSDENPNACSLM